MAEPFAFYGTLVHSLSANEPMVLWENAIMVVKDGKICHLQKDIGEGGANEIAKEHNVDDSCFRKLVKPEFIMPGFIDTHIHAPQYVIAGTGYDETLLDWLQKYTFPTESAFKDAKFARDAYSKVVRRTLMHGTTTASYFATIHLEASLILAEIMQKYGQRGNVGKVNMDTNAPDYYIETTSQSLSDTEEFIKTMKEKYGEPGLITPCVTPRFSVTCSQELLLGLGELSKKYDVPIQTHLSENRDEIKFVQDSHDVSEYVHVYENAGLLTDKTILAHCVYSGDVELEVLKKFDCGISHCPNSNTSIRSGAMDIRKVEEYDIKIGLGTDVSGGYSPSLQDSLRKAQEISKLLSVFNDGEYKSINHCDAFYLATLGGARVMNLDNKIGNFEVGKEFDALIISPAHENSPFDVFELNSHDDIIQKFLFCGDDRNITDIYVAGKRINLDI